MKLLKGLLLLAGIVCLVFALIPSLMYGILNTGVVALAVLAVVCTTLAVLLESPSRRSPWEVFAHRGRVKSFFRILLSTALCCFLVAEIALSAGMYWFGWRNPPQPDSNATAVVLGAGLKNDQPSRILTYRLESALLYLNEHPDAQVVVTGGLGPRATRTEGEAMAEWLTKRGIDPARILLENQSLDTRENLRNAVTLLSENNMPQQMVLFTDGFHQWRSQMYARLAVAENTGEPTAAKFFGAQITGIPNRTPWGLIPCYWLREQAALAEAFLFTDIGQLYWDRLF